MDKPSGRKIYSETAALSKSQKYCAIQERCQQEMRNKLYEWGLFPQQVESIIAELISDGFINEERFARQFARGKFRIKKWGKRKIAIELQQRKVSDYCIQKSFEEIDDSEYRSTLERLMEKKSKELHEADPYILKNKLARYAFSKGFETELVWEILKATD